jgi:hypothetical protein
MSTYQASALGFTTIIDTENDTGSIIDTTIDHIGTLIGTTDIAMTIAHTAITTVTEVDDMTIIIGPDTVTIMTTAQRLDSLSDTIVTEGVIHTETITTAMAEKN